MSFLDRIQDWIFGPFGPQGPQGGQDTQGAQGRSSGRAGEARARELPAEPIGEPVSLNEFLVLNDTPGKSVTPATAITNTAALGCVLVLSQSVASLPLITYRRTRTAAGPGKERATDHMLYGRLHDLPNPEMTSFDLRETLMAHLALWGNAYCEIELNGRGDVLGMWPMRPDKTWPMRHKDGQIWYHTRLPDNTEVALPKYRVWHIRNFSLGGIVGLSPIALAREAIGLSRAGEELGSRFFANGARPGGILQHPAKLSPEAYERLKASWEGRHQGLTNVNRIAILEEGLTWKDVGMPLKDAEFLETRKFQNAEIARIFRVPLHMIQDMQGATFSNIEHQGIEFVVHSLRPWLVRMEQSISRDLIGAIERNSIFTEFLVDGLLRGDLPSRYNAYNIGRTGGWLSRNDIRGMENMNPIAGGDDYLTPLNMGVLGQEPPAPPAPALSSAPSSAAQPADAPADAQAQRALRVLVADAANRIAQRAGDRDEKHRVWVRDVIRPVAQALAGEESVSDLPGMDYAVAELVESDVERITDFWFRDIQTSSSELAAFIWFVCYGNAGIYHNFDGAKAQNA